MTPAICVVKNERPIDESVFRFLLQYVQQEKRERILRQRVKQNADNMLVGDVLAKYMVKKVFGIPFTEQRISYGSYGKPYLTDYPNVHFNLSHSGQYVACAVCDVPVGLDIQTIVPYKAEVAHRVCNEKEVAQIEMAENPAIEFTKVWAQKEAWVKLRGASLSFIEVLSKKGKSKENEDCIAKSEATVMPDLLLCCVWLADSTWIDISGL